MGTTANVYINLGSAPAYGDRCQEWVEIQLLGHAGVYADPIAAEASPDFRRVTNALAIPAGVEVIFGPAASNEGLGHGGIALGDGQMTSVWSDGSIVREDIARFSAGNGAPVVGYQNFGRGAPGPAAASAGRPAAPAGLPANLRALLPVGAALLGAAIVADELFG